MITKVFKGELRDKLLAIKSTQRQYSSNITFNLTISQVTDDEAAFAVRLGLQIFLTDKRLMRIEGRNVTKALELLGSPVP